MSGPQPTPDNHRINRGISLALVGFVTALLAPVTAQAATYTVNNGNDFNGASCPSDCTLRAAVRAANDSPGEDTILIPDGLDVTLSQSGSGEDSAVSGDLDIDDDLTITGEMAGGYNTISAGGIDRAFHIRGNAWVVLQNLSIQAGALTNDAGAGIYVTNSATLELHNSQVRNNIVSLNQAALDNTVSTGQVQIWGGGIHVDGQATALIDSSEIFNNKAPANGGVSNAGRAEIRKSQIYANTATGAGGENANDLFSNGGGIGNLGGYLAVGDSNIYNNVSYNQGGGIYVTNLGLNTGNVIITNSTISGNQAEINGGGIANLGPTTVNHSVISNNTITGGGNGAGVYNHAGATTTLDIVNSTISGNGNTTTHSGGGIFNSRDMTLHNVTLYNNTAYPCGACGDNAAVGGNEIAMFRTDAANPPSLTVANTVIMDGADSNPGEGACEGQTSLISSVGNSMSGDNSCNLTDSADQTNITTPGLDTGLTTTTDTGSDTVEHTGVHKLLAASPAIDLGENTTCPIVDQRFLERDDGKCDIGAVEYGATTQRRTDLVDIKVTITDSPDPAPPNKNDSPLTYVVTVTNQYVDNSANGIYVRITLPDSYSFLRVTWVSTGAEPTCDGPDSNNVLDCNIANLPGLERTEFFITGIPTREGTITLDVDAFPWETDAFQRNNIDITETTDIDPEADCVVNFDCNGSGSGGGGGGGGVPSPVALLLLSGLALLRHRRA